MRGSRSEIQGPVVDFELDEPGRPQFAEFVVTPTPACQTHRLTNCQGLSAIAFINGVFAVEVLMSFLVPSTSGLAVLSMPRRLVTCLVDGRMQLAETVTAAVTSKRNVGSDSNPFDQTNRSKASMHQAMVISRACQQTPTRFR